MSQDMDFDDLFIDVKGESYSDERFKGTRLDSIQFKNLQKDDSSQANPASDAAWIDGGSATLYATPIRAIALIKACILHTKGFARDHIRIISSIVSITLQDDIFTIRQKPLQSEHLDIPSEITRQELCDSSKSFTPEMMIDVVRSVAEKNLANSIDGAAFIDGSIRSDNPFLQKIELAGNITSISKTSMLTTSMNRPVAIAVASRAPKGTWITIIDDICYAKLHARSSYIFSIEGDVSDQKIGIISAWSNDAAFIGYPYPMILADQLARVTNNEKDMWRAVLRSKRSKLNTAIKDESSSIDAHDVLEHMLYGKE